MVVALGAAASSVASKLTGGLIHGSSAGTSIAQQNTAYAAAMAGDATGLRFLVKSAWWIPGEGGAPNAAAADDARAKLRALRAAGVATGTDNKPDWTLVTKSNSAPGNPNAPAPAPSDAPGARFMGSMNWGMIALVAVGGFLAVKFLRK
jgi:hypothetical protein